MRSLLSLLVFAVAAFPLSAQNFPSPAQLRPFRVDASLLPATSAEVLSPQFVALDPVLHQLAALARAQAKHTAGSSSRFESLKGIMPVHEAVDGWRVRVLLKSRTVDASRALLIEARATVGAVAGDIISCDLPVGVLERIAMHPATVAMQASPVLEAELDVSRKAIRADLLHNGTGLASPLTGSGVLFGCIDGGFDWTHPDFSTATGTRIRFLWDQGDQTSTTASPPVEYGYGREYSDASINAGLCRESDGVEGHGTHVASIGSGNGRANSAYTGIAPGADLALVKNGRANTSSFEGDIIDACDFLFRRAATRQQPCVINISMGTMMGAHDGTSVLEQGIDKLTGPGRIIVMSAGNHSYYPQHLRYTTGGDATEPRITFFRTYDSPWLQIDIWYRGGPVNVGIAAYDPYPSLRRVSGLVAAGTQRTGIDMMAGMASITNVASDPANGMGHATITIQQYPAGLVLPQMLFALYTSGSGTLDAWIWHGLFGETRSDADHIIPGDRECSMGVPSTAHNVISVASHVTKTSWVDVTGATQLQEGEPVLGALSGFSSRGPTRDGRFAPDLSAPGEAIVAAMSKDGPVEQRSQIFGGWYRKYQGTSMAAPHVAGTVALMLERNPSLDVAAVRDALRSTAKRDAFTGIAPNLKYGYGKLDAYAAVLAVPPKKEPGAALPLSVTLSAFPNPSATDATLTWTQPHDGDISLRMYDALGREIADLAHGAKEAGTHQIAVPMSALPSGVYFCRISTQSGAATARLLRTAW